MWIDFSANGSLMDEATLITAVAGVGFGIVKIWQATHRNAQSLDEVKETLNNVDGTPTSRGETSMGYRIVRIERQVDSIQETIHDLAGAMTEHIQWEEKKSSRIDERLSDVEATLEVVRECMQTHHPDTDPPAKPKRPRK